MLGVLSVAALTAFVWANEQYKNLERAETLFQSFTLHLGQEQYDAALIDIEQASARSPSNAYYLASEALLHERMVRNKVEPWKLSESREALTDEDLNHIRAAAALYQQALKLNPIDDSFYHNLGWLYFYLKQPQQASGNLRKAITIDGTIPLYHVSMGILLEHLREPDKALQEYSHALQLSPALLDSQFFIDFKKRAPEEAQMMMAEVTTLLERRLQTDRSPLTKAKLGKLYLNQNSRQKAAEMLSETTIELPSLSFPWFNLGYLNEISGNEEVMENYYERAVFLDGAEVLPWWRLGEYHYDRGQTPEAIRCYRRAVENWLHQSSAHARRASRVYRTRVSVSDDVIPKRLLSYVGPALDVAATARKLSFLYEEVGNDEQSRYFKALSAKLTDSK